MFETAIRYEEKCNCRHRYSIAKMNRKLYNEKSNGIFFNNIYGIKNAAPLILGVGENENFLASDISAILSYTRKFIILDDNEIVKLNENKYEIYHDDKIINKKEQKYIHNSIFKSIPEYSNLFLIM